MLDEGRNACCLSGCDKRANFFKLIVLKRDGDLGGRHTKNHTTAARRVSSNMLVSRDRPGGLFHAEGLDEEQEFGGVLIVEVGVFGQGWIAGTGEYGFEQRDEGSARGW